MARREITQFFDDLDNSPLSESEVKVVEFSFRGNDYIIDLSEENAETFANALQPYIQVARKKPATRGRATNRNKPQRNREIRAWAVANGIQVPARGRLSADIVARYDAAHS
ncbi:Lsr2 family protein [Corynebacterium sp. 320]|uniref:histone-like nucleoid-structuring protein Lsr2 n=1 Tax=Corynebacterium TaxID=1716 RepID=UPI00125CBA5C|nr:MULTISPECIES: Lsr2 family protein [Corynebacterium]KAB1503208.1 Lsr2 family protein [Corynebacterium sp. 320]KAB1550579.1 Lsr2 family protein [Corynebacterium sp. 321]KAB1550940.1 Lsr2 family protein [Corynebacterium sp. 319]KAB3527005.1 Lsr2 family protein [Corynebacterium sp. 250]KAB3538497.1 Lsr2 family protein [Corynebacterium sp. 366]